MKQASRALRQLAAIGLLVLLLGGIVAAVGLPLQAHIAGLEEDIASRRGLLQRYGSALAGLKAQDSTQEFVLPPDADTFFLEGDIVSIALAELQSRMNEMAGDAGLRFSSLSALPLSEQDDLRLVGVQVLFQTDMASLQQLLHRIETARPLFVVSNLTIRSTGPAPLPEDLEPEANPGAVSPERILDVQFVVQGAMKGAEAAP